MALRHEQIFPAVVVEIFEADTPSGTPGSQCAEAGFQALIAETALAIVVIERIEFAWEFGHEYVGASIVVIVLEHCTHDGKAFAVRGEARPGIERAFFESAIAIVVKKILLHAVVGHENVGKAVAVIVGEGNTEGPPLLSRDAGALAYVFEGTVPAIAIEHATGRR